jgi:catecholate siderophore receptor
LGSLLLAGPAAAQTDGPVQLGPVSVSDQADRNGLSHSPPLASMPSASLQDTPQAVNVIDQQTMKSQATTTLSDALRNVPGITIAIGEGGTLAGDQFKIRGFDAKDDVYLDGLRDFGAYTRDSFNYEEVQVLKGPSGLMFGRGTTGGAINTLSKTPFLRDRYFAGIEGGNGDHVRATADLNYVFSDTGAVRLNLMVTDTGVVDRDMVHVTRWGIAPTLALGLGTDTQFSLAYLHQHSTGIPDYGITVAQRPGQLIAEPASEYGVPRDTFLGYNTDRDRNDTDIVTMKLTHQAAPWLTLSNDARVAVYSRYFQYTTIDRCDFTLATNFCSNVLFGSTPSAALAESAAVGRINRTAGARRMSPPPRRISLSGLPQYRHCGIRRVLSTRRPHHLCLYPADHGPVHLHAERSQPVQSQYRPQPCSIRITIRRRVIGHSCPPRPPSPIPRPRRPRWCSPAATPPTSPSSPPTVSISRPNGR